VNELLNMGDYGFYVWSSYAIFVAVLAWDAVAPYLRARRHLRSLVRRRQRDAARKAA
jgi:heme exporter protein D